MHYYEVAPNQIIRSDEISFTYYSENQLEIGQIVLVEIGKKQLAGVIIKTTKKPSYPTKGIISIVEPNPIPLALINLAHWLSNYYCAAYATTLQTILPSGIQKKHKLKIHKNNVTKRDRTNIVLNTQQLLALETLNKFKSGTFLLQGITGSGKTELYMNIIKATVQDGKSAIVIIPEISLTSQLVSEFSLHFDRLLVTHSKMSEQARYSVWKESLDSVEPLVIIGPRSALFMPLKKIGVIVIDEAHEPSLKQEQAPKYSALRVATMLGRYHNAKVILGSATPSITDRYLAERSNRPILKLDSIARKNSLSPIISVIDMKKRNNFKKHRFLSDQLLECIADNLRSKKQTLIFHNRRGSTNITLCDNCGWTSECSNCHLPLTLHADKHQLCCHICGQGQNIPTSCPVCSQANIIHKGVGTKLIESEIYKLFPNAATARFDADNKTAETLEKRYGELYDGSINIIIGTQIIAKGLDLPHLRTVGVIQADLGLTMPDFSTNERSFQLLSQVIGRVGRNEHQTKVIVQTYQPNHPCIKHGIKQNYDSFYEQELSQRQIGLFPPFTHLLKLTCIYKSETGAIKNAKKFADELREKAHPDVQILGPAPAFHERQGDNYRWQLTIKSPKREYLIDIINITPKSHWQSELDPTSLL